MDIDSTRSNNKQADPALGIGPQDEGIGLSIFDQIIRPPKYKNIINIMYVRYFPYRIL